MQAYICIVFFLSLILSCQSEATQKNICTPKESMRAYEDASSLRNWDEVYASFKRFSHCNNENVVEAWGAYSEVIAHLLAENWGNFDRLVTLTLLDRNFEKLVIKHIADETIASDKLQQVIKNAHENCPPNGKKLCEKIVAAAK